ncbi:hypothetical protein H4S08_002254 [Coemansia sp. RSA 1365]|nr:hypothetical protein H4S08_002254 [Coemansia sp. RSA 1365]
MPKKFRGENSKVTAAKEKKATAKSEKDAQDRKKKEQEESKKWGVGAKQAGKKEDQEAKRLEKLARKKEAEELLAAENKTNAKSTASRTGGPSKLGPAVKTSSKPATASSPAVRGVEKKAEAKEKKTEQIASENRPVEEFAASNMDDALLLMDTVNDGPGSPGAGSALRGAQAVVGDRHPERRAKAAYEAYKAVHIPLIKEENPRLRQSQVDQLLFKSWKKAPENPRNQASVAYNAKQSDIDQLSAKLTEQAKEHLRI